MNFPLTVELSTATLKLKPGASAEVVVAIRNVSPIVQHYEAMIVGLPSDDLWSRDAEMTKLRPGEAGTIGVTIALPPDTQLLGGTYVLGVLVRSPYQPREVSRAAELSLTVETIAGVTVTAFPEIVHGKDDGYFSVTVANTGNTAVALDLTAADDQGKASFTITPPGVALSAGGTQPVQVQIRSRGPFSGNERRSSVTVRAAAGGEQRGEAKVTFVQQPRVAAAVLRVLGVALAVAVVAGSIMGGAVLANRQSTPTGPTLQPTQQQPTSVTTSASGQKPPPLPKFTVDPSQPTVGAEVAFTADVSDEVTSIEWKIIRPGGELTGTFVQASFAYAFDAAGAWLVELTVAGDGGERITKIPVMVSEKASQVVEVKLDLAVGTDEVVTATVDCGEDQLATGGGAFADPLVAQELQYESSRPIDGGQGWSLAVRNNGSEELTITAMATCVAKFDGLRLESQTEENPSSVPREIVATCDPGEVVVGGGGGMTPDPEDPTSRVDMAESLPVRESGAPYAGWRVRASSTTDRTLEAWAWCAAEPAGYDVVTDSQDAAPNNGRVEGRAVCAAGQAIGGGIGFGEGAVQVDASRQIILRASSSLTVKPSEMAPGWYGSATFSDTIAQVIDVFAICAQLNE